MGIIIGIVAIIFVIALNLGKDERHKYSIEAKIDEIGGRLLSYEKRHAITGTGPFVIVGKGCIIYRIEYELGGVKKEGWVKLGGIFGPDWRLEF